MIFKYWKYIALLIAVAGLFASATIWYNNQIDAAYNRGVVAENIKWEKRVAKENSDNRKFEVKLDEVIDAVRKEIRKEEKVRVEKETKYIGTVESIIRDNPISAECRVPQEVLDARNEIRKLGPESKQ